MADPTHWLDADERAVWLALAGVMMRLPTALDGQLQQDSGVTFFEYTVLAMLSEQDDRSLGMSDLAVLASGSLSRLSHVVSRLEQRGLVRRHRVAGSGRRTDVELLDAGLALIEDGAAAHVDHVRGLVFDAVDPDDLPALRRACRAVNGRLGPFGPPGEAQ